MVRKLILALTLLSTPALAQGKPPDPNREVTLTLGEIQQLVRAGSMHAVADEIASGPSKKLNEQLQAEDKSR